MDLGCDPGLQAKPLVEYKSAGVAIKIALQGGVNLTGSILRSIPYGRRGNPPAADKAPIANMGLSQSLLVNLFDFG